MKSFALIGIFSLLNISFPFHSSAQDTLAQRRVDSLKSALLTTQGADRFDMLYRLAWEYSNVIETESLNYAVQAYELALKLGDSVRIIKGGRINATQLRRIEDMDRSIQLAERILPIAKRHKEMWEVQVLLTSLAISYTVNKAEYDKALKYNFDALTLAEKEGNKPWATNVLTNIGLVYYKLNDPKRALDFYEKALNIKRQGNDKYSLDRLLINMSLCYNNLGKYSEAKKFVREGVNACEGKCADQIILEAEIALGNTLLTEKLYAESAAHLEKSYEISKRVGNLRFQSENLNCLAEINLGLKKYDAAIKCLRESQRIAEQKGYRLLAHRVYKLFVELYIRIGDHKNSSLFQSKYIALNDSIYGEKVVSNLVKLFAEHEQRENTRVIAEKNEVLTLQAQLLEKQKLQTYLSGLIAALLLILTVVIYWNYREKLSINKRLDQKVKERTEELREVNNDLTKAYELRESAIRRTWQDTQGIILGMYGLCHAAQLDLADDKAKEYIHRFEESASRLTSLFSKIDN